MSTLPVCREAYKMQLTYLLTYSMEQSPSWEANWFVASQEIPRVLWNPKVHHRTQKRPLPVPILSQPNPVHTPTIHFLKVHPNIILPPTPGSPQRYIRCNYSLKLDTYHHSVPNGIDSNQIPWILALWPSGLWHGAVWWLVISISEERTAFTFKAGESIFLPTVDNHPSN
jgi:hypothetical protein